MSGETIQIILLLFETNSAVDNSKSAESFGCPKIACL